MPALEPESSDQLLVDLNGERARDANARDLPVLIQQVDSELLHGSCVVVVPRRRCCRPSSFSPLMLAVILCGVELRALPAFLVDSFSTTPYSWTYDVTGQPLFFLSIISGEQVFRLSCPWVLLVVPRLLEWPLEHFFCAGLLGPAIPRRLILARSGCASSVMTWRCIACRLTLLPWKPLNVKSLASANNHIDNQLDELLAKRRASGHGGVIGPSLSVPARIEHEDATEPAVSPFLNEMSDVLFTHSFVTSFQQSFSNKTNIFERSKLSSVLRSSSRTNIDLWLTVNFLHLSVTVIHPLRRCRVLLRSRHNLRWDHRNQWARANRRDLSVTFRKYLWFRTLMLEIEFGTYGLQNHWKTELHSRRLWTSALTTWMVHHRGWRLSSRCWPRVLSVMGSICQNSRLRNVKRSISPWTKNGRVGSGWMLLSCWPRMKHKSSCQTMWQPSGHDVYVEKMLVRELPNRHTQMFCWWPRAEMWCKAVKNLIWHSHWCSHSQFACSLYGSHLRCCASMESV